MHRSFLGPAILGLALAMVAMSNTTRADFLTMPDGLQPDTFGIQIDTSTLMPVGDPEYAVAYRLSLTIKAVLKATDRITIFDITGVGTPTFTSTPDFWGSSSALLNPSPIPSIPLPFPDDPNIRNVTFTYFGPTIDNTAGTTAVPLGLFLVRTDIPVVPGSPPPPGLLARQAYFSLTSTPDTTSTVLSFGITTPSLVPEPSSLVLIGSGLLPVALLWRRRRRSVAAGA